MAFSVRILDFSCDACFVEQTYMTFLLSVMSDLADHTTVMHKA